VNDCQLFEKERKEVIADLRRDERSIEPKDLHRFISNIRRKEGTRQMGRKQLIAMIHHIKDYVVSLQRGLESALPTHQEKR